MFATSFSKKTKSVDKGQEFVRNFRLTSSESEVLARPTADEGDGNVPPGSARHRNRGPVKDGAALGEGVRCEPTVIDGCRVRPDARHSKA
jgi:hypothetical protein